VERAEECGEGWVGRADGEDFDVLFMGFISDSHSIPLLVFIESMLIKNSSKLGRTIILPCLGI
jgi:hypothetical protein